MIFDQGDGWVVYQGESESLLPGILGTSRTIHFVTDPPYGIGLEYGERPDNWRPGWDFWKLLYDHSDMESTLHMTVSNRHLPQWLGEVLKGGWRYLHTSVYYNQGRAGGNANGQFAYAWEPLLAFSKTGSITLRRRMLSDVFGHRSKRYTDHPAERDLGAWREYISHLPPGLLVDPFLGSGTTLRAALDLGREAIGVEREQRWCRQAALRCSQMTLFTGYMPNPALEPEQLLEEREH